MKYLILTIAILSLLIGCAPAEAPTPAAQPAEVLEPQMPEEPAEEAEMAEGTVHDVTIKGFRYDSSALTIKVGDTVRWTNEDKARHDANGAGWSTPLLSKGESGEYTFTEPGTYEYICSLHPNMQAKVIVVE